MNSDDVLADFEAFRDLPHAITLLGMSEVGKTLLSTGLRRSASCRREVTSVHEPMISRGLPSSS